MGSKSSSQVLDQPVDVLLVSVRVRANAQVPAATTQYHILFEAAFSRRVMVSSRKVKGNDAGPVLASSIADDFSSTSLQTLAGISGDLAHAFRQQRLVWREPEATQHSQAGPQSQQASHVLGTSFIPRGSESKFELDPREIMSLHDAVPADAQGTQQV